MTAAAGDRPQSPLSEFELIDVIHRRFGATGRSVIRGIGDDAAIVRPAARRDVLITTDLLAEGVHFDLRTTDWESIGYRAATANLSDIAAMGGVPQHLLISLAIPATCSTRDVMALYRGIAKACRPYGADLIGGDTSASQNRVFMSLTVTGAVQRGRALRRDGATVGDYIYVTGTLGDALGGLRLLQNRQERLACDRLRPTIARYLIARHTKPTPRVSIGNMLSTRRLATAAIDLSDGLSGDLRHICRQSGVGAEIDRTALPISRALYAYAGVVGVDAAQLALAGGEDYELLFTVRPEARTALVRAARPLSCRMTCIGRIRPKTAGLMLYDDGQRRPLPQESYDHFQTSSVPRATC